jgi:polysaccharide biosynthesis protein PslH
MKILLVHHRLPWPLNNGMDKLRYNLIRTLSTKYDLTLAVPDMNDADKTGIEEIKKYVKKLIIIPVKDLRDDSFLFFIKRILYLLFLRRPYYISDCYSKTFNSRLQSIIKTSNFDFINYLSDFSGQYLLSQSNKQKIILGPLDDNVQTYYENYLDANNLKTRIISYINYILIKHYFKKIITRSKIVYFHSSDDLNRAASRINKKINANVLPVATELEEDENGFIPVEPRSVVFVGGMGSSFNQDAVWFFIKKIFPLIKEKVPDIKFYIVGNHPPEDIQKLHDGKSIIVTGAVENVEPYIKKTAIYVSPIQRGTGIKTKMVEAMKAGKAIVATNKALQGLWEIDKEAIRVENDPTSFANAVIEILKNDELRVEMERKTKNLYLNHYLFEKVVPITLKIYSNNL